MEPPSSDDEGSRKPIQGEADYDYVKEIARGGYGIVYLFRSDKLKHEIGEEFCAGKFVYAHMFAASGDGGIDAYRRAFAGLNNFQKLTGSSDDLLRILHVRERHEEGYFCYMMELADDIETFRQIDPDRYRPKTLKRAIEPEGIRRRLPAAECIKIALALARGLHLLHENGFIHRDVRPTNIIFVKGVPKLADIDLLAGSDATLTSYIPEDYRAPEGSHTHRADIFSLGKTLYEMGMGLPAAAYPKLPPNMSEWEDHKTVLWINRVIGKACAQDLRKRYGSAKQLLDDLERIRKGKSPRNDDLGKQVLIAAALLILLMAMVFAFGIKQERGRRPSESANPTSLAWSPPQGARSMIPDAKLLAEAHVRLRSTSTPPTENSPAEARAQYAASLLDAYDQSSPLPHLLARLELARDTAAGAAKTDVAMRACDLIKANFEIPQAAVSEMKVRALERVLKAGRTRAVHKDVAESAFKLGFLSLAMDDYPNATAAATTARSACDNVPGELWSSQAMLLTYLEEEGREWWRQTEIYSKKLAIHPDDPKASAECGKYLCFIKNTWDRGLELLLKGDDAKLVELAKSESAKPGSADEQMELADAWWKLGEASVQQDRKYCQQRAFYWYSIIQSSSGGTDLSDKAKARREEFLRLYPSPSATLVLRLNVEGGASMEVSSDDIRLRSSHGVRDVRINCLYWGDFRPGGPHILKNRGETRYLPAGLDFSKAHIIKQTKSKSWATVKNFVAAADRIRITLVDSPAGSVDFMLVISFDAND